LGESAGRIGPTPWEKGRSDPRSGQKLHALKGESSLRLLQFGDETELLDKAYARRINEEVFLLPMFQT
jgi:hypothetical protein